MPLAFEWVGEGQAVVGISGQSPPLVVNKMVMVGAEADEVVGGGLSAVLPVCDVVDFADCVSAPGESASAAVSDGDCFAHR